MTFLIWPSQFGNTLWSYLNKENGMCSVCRQSVGEQGKPQTDEAYTFVQSVSLYNPSIRYVWQLLFNVKKASSRSSGRHIKAAEHTGVKLSVSAVGSMPRGCHITRVSWLKSSSSQDKLHLCCSRCSNWKGHDKTDMENLIQCECAISDYGWWHCDTSHHIHNSWGHMKESESCYNLAC